MPLYLYWQILRKLSSYETKTPYSSLRLSAVGISRSANIYPTLQRCEAEEWPAGSSDGRSQYTGVCHCCCIRRRLACREARPYWLRTSVRTHDVSRVGQRR